jgi:glycosyltransferase involved in cell wall biosynthesis
MAAGLPIVATNAGGIPEIVTDGENGFLVEPRDSQQLAEKILLVLQNESISKRFSVNNTNKAKRYNWEEIVTSLEKVYLKVKSR